MTSTRADITWQVEIIAVLAGLLGATASAANPYPPSPILAGITWNEASKQRYAAGSDLWDSAWASDGNVYSAWGDGWGFAGRTKAQMGFTQLSGYPSDHTLIGIDVFYGMNNPPECPGDVPAVLGGKPAGTVGLPNGLLYSFHSAGADLDDGGDCAVRWLARSTDNGTSWTDHIGNLQWPDTNGFAPSAVLQYGRAQAGSLAPDITGTPYLYFYGTKKSRPVYEQYLARVPATAHSIESLNAWQYYAGLDVSGNPVWNASSAPARPVWTDTNNGQWLEVMFDPAVGRYLAYNDHGTACQGQPCERQVSLFDAPSPWGPWTTFDYEEQFDNLGCGANCLGNRVEVSFILLQKWLSADGLTLWPAYSSTGTYDSLNLIEGTMRLAPGSSVKGLATSTGTPAVLDRLALSNPGNLEYVDRTYRLTAVPSHYLGLEVIRLANNDKSVAASDYVTFTSTVTQNVCLGWDRSVAVPTWLSSWTRTAEQLTGHVTLQVYRKQVTAGPVRIPGAATHNNNYLLLIGC